ncbi:hypothetical protein [Phenylobacterium montanum]|uniref:Uncharacterized protein n=1 Tax=Phenylobacterium montanum TaxID=2823693 RepID=A0A975IVE4_9CAUL|nr:hypothetical protein [Caulobacter sp. S6]QUD88758.1 hypothetical protein KCG34_02400 [Caulobacter sp. S6]
MNPTVTAVVTAGVIGVALFGGWLLWLNYSPASDVPRLKRDYEGVGRHVLSVTRTGTEFGETTYRKYEVVLQDDLHGGSTIVLGVEAALYGDPRVDRFDDPKSNTPVAIFWLIVQWFLP